MLSECLTAAPSSVVTARPMKLTFSVMEDFTATTEEGTAISLDAHCVSQEDCLAVKKSVIRLNFSGGSNFSKEVPSMDVHLWF